MIRTKARRLAFAAIVAALVSFGTSSAFAGWGHYSSGGSWGSSGGSSGSWGSSGGSSGSWGSSGGSSGSWGSSGGSYGSHGGLFSRWRARHHRHHYRVYHHSSGGSWGSSGGSSGSSGGSWGYSSYGSHGSSGGSSGGVVMYSSPTIVQKSMDSTTTAPADNYQTPSDTGSDAPADSGVSPTPPPPEIPDSSPLPGPGSGVRNGNADSAILAVNVPEDARVFVNGMATKSTGANRRYVSRGLSAGYGYTYEVRAEATRNGKLVEETKTVRVTAGQTLALAFDLSAPLETTVTVRVPEQAKVELAGHSTKASGTVRTFATSSLEEGKVWSDYVIRVSLDRNGQTITKEKKIDLKAGDNVNFEFDFADNRVASTN